jgi:GTP-binding protein HflX
MIPVKGRSKAYLVILQTWQRSKTYLEESTEEMKELTRSCSVEVTGVSQAHLPHPSPSHFLREGKLEEVRELAKASGAKVLFFNVDLTPAQVRNIEKFTKLPAVDRTGLILDIFGRRAQTSEGKLQVELARLEYMLPRLGGLGVVFSRLGGGIGTRGPGETELESDRRKFRKRIQRVKEELKKVKKHRELLRAGRRRRNFTAVALLAIRCRQIDFNALTGASTYVEDKLFAT